MQILYELNGERGFPRLIYYIKDKSYSTIVMSLLSDNLEKLFLKCNKKFSLNTVLLIADQMISRIEFLHSKCYVHRDIKPENFLIGTGDNKNVIHLIDFGLSKKYILDNGNHIPFKNNKGLVGTVRFSSVYSHLGIEQSRRDDLESLGYLFVYFLKGTLPWFNLPAKNKEEKYEKIKELKLRMEIEDIVKGLPQEFYLYLNYIRKIEFDVCPNYNYLKKIFRNLMAKSKYSFQSEFDWEEKCEDEEIDSMDNFYSKILNNLFSFC